MEFALLGWPVDEPRLRLDYRRFSYAGKFVTDNTGIAVVRGEPPAGHREPSADHESTGDSLPPLPDGLDADEFVDGILAAVAFNADRTEPDTLWLRYLTVRNDLRGSGLALGPRLAAFISDCAATAGYETVRIAVNNVFSYHALYKAGFAFTTRETGIAELILERPADERAEVTTVRYQRGLDRFREREGLSPAEREFLAAHEDAEPPAAVAPPHPRRSTRGFQIHSVQASSMGNADLRSLAALSECPFADIEGSVIAVDAHNWLYRYLTTTVKWTNDSIYTTDDGTEVANLVGIVQGLPKFFEHDLTPVFVFDGGVTDLKDDEVERRRENRKEAEERLEQAKEDGDAIEAARLSARTVRLTETIHETSRELLDLLDVPYIDAPAEGEAQASYMNRIGDADYVGSEDYDTLLFGAPRTLRGLTSKGHPELMELQPTLDSHEISYEQLVDAAMLCGTDFNEGINGIGPKTAIKLIKEHGDLFGVLEARGDHIEFADRIRELFFDPPVTDEYSFDRSIEPDLAAAREYVTGEWEVDAGEVERGFERIESAVVQTGLDRWS